MGGDRIGIIGAGTIGVGVAYACSQGGYEVLLIDHDETVRASVERRLRAYRRLGRLKGDAPASGSVKLSTEVAGIARCDFVIENIVERWDAKRTLYERIGPLLPNDAVVAVNTSAIPIGRVAALLPQPGRVIGAHFMNPVPQTTMVEVVEGEGTSRSTTERLVALIGSLGKDSVIVRDAPGFVINRLLMPLVNGAARIVGDGVATAEQVDQLFKGCLGHAMGPLRTADLIGLDTVVDTLRVLEESGTEGDVEVAPLLLDKIACGHLGEKAGAGFFDYTKGD